MWPEDRGGCSEMQSSTPASVLGLAPVGLTLLAEGSVTSPAISPGPTVFVFYHIFESFYSDPTEIYFYPLLLVYLGT